MLPNSTSCNPDYSKWKRGVDLKQYIHAAKYFTWRQYAASTIPVTSVVDFASYNGWLQQIWQQTDKTKLQSDFQVWKQLRSMNDLNNWNNWQAWLQQKRAYKRNPTNYATNPGMLEYLLLSSIIAGNNGSKNTRAIYRPETAVNFPSSSNVFIKSVIEIDFTYRFAWARLPLFRGVMDNAANPDCYYIITEASDPNLASQMGVNFAPRMKNIGDGSGYQRVTVDNNGLMHFSGTVDFNKVHSVIPGTTTPFPPQVVKAGGLADANWSSFVILPDGVVLNAQMVQNSTGTMGRLQRMNIDDRTMDVIMLDGFQNGGEYFYHIVTDVSVELPAALENGYVAPRLANIPSFASTGSEATSAVLGFSPVLNGPMQLGKEQGFNVSINNKGIDPINVFPLPPDNSNLTDSNRYSPMWDAHVSQWTAAAVKAGKVRRITGFADLKSLVGQGLVESAYINPPGPSNPTVFGLRATKAFINCPVIAQPKTSPKP